MCDENVETENTHKLIDKTQHTEQKALMQLM